MSTQEVVFYLIAVATALSAIATVTSRNLVHAALFLAATLAGIAGVFVVLHADFVAMVQLVVYVGAIAILFLFGLMLTRAPIGREALDSQNRGLAAAISLIMFAVLATLIVDSSKQFTSIGPIAGPNVDQIGVAIFASWVFPFEVASMLLLGGLVGAILLSRRESGESGEEIAVTVIQTGEAPSNEPAGELVASTGGDA